VLLENANDLFFGEPAALHLWSFRLGQSLTQTGLDPRGNVTHGIKMMRGGYRLLLRYPIKPNKR
jgi:hypothetical protein